MSGSPGQIKYLRQLAAEWRSEAAAIRANLAEGRASTWPKRRDRVLTSDEALLRAQELEGCADDLIGGLGGKENLS
jgi:hypothetical protein